MTLPWGLVAAPVADSVPVRPCWEPAGANRLEESYDKASLFRGRKFRLGAACCKTSARQATSLLKDRHSRDYWGIPDNRGRFVRRSGAGWRFRRSGEKTARPGGRHARRKRRWFVLQRRAAESLPASPESAA